MGEAELLLDDGPHICVRPVVVDRRKVVDDEFPLEAPRLIGDAAGVVHAMTEVLRFTGRVGLPISTPPEIAQGGWQLHGDEVALTEIERPAVNSSGVHASSAGVEGRTAVSRPARRRGRELARVPLVGLDAVAAIDRSFP
jgi:hypothetical protein